MGEGCFRSMDTLSEAALLQRMSLSPIGINHIEIVIFRESGTLPSEVNLLSRGLALCFPIVACHGLKVHCLKIAESSVEDSSD